MIGGAMLSREEADRHCRLMQAALSEAGRPDLAKLLSVGEHPVTGAWTVQFKSYVFLFFPEDDFRLIHKAHLVVDGWRYCYDCWRTQDMAVIRECRHLEEAS